MLCGIFFNHNKTLDGIEIKSFDPAQVPLFIFEEMRFKDSDLVDRGEVGMF